MTTPTKHPQEVEVWYILPAIRRELVLAFKERGLNQKKIAQILNITEPAVSQYISQKRAKDIIFPKDVLKMIKESAAKIVDSKTAYREIQKINTFIKKSKALCAIHRGVEGSLDKCEICYRE